MLSVARWNQCEHPPVAVRFARDLSRQVRRHSLDVLHQRDRVLENLVVDALQDDSAPARRA